MIDIAALLEIERAIGALDRWIRQWTNSTRRGLVATSPYAAMDVERYADALFEKLEPWPIPVFGTLRGDPEYGKNWTVAPAALPLSKQGRVPTHMLVLQDMCRPALAAAKEFGTWRGGKPSIISHDAMQGLADARTLAKNIRQQAGPYGR